MAETAFYQRIFSVPFGVPFLDTLAQALIEQRLGTPGREQFALSDMTVLLPTRRAVGALQEAFLRHAAGAALLLPTIRAISQTDEDESFLQAFSQPQPDPVSGRLLAASIDPLERQLVLAKMIQQWAYSSPLPDGTTLMEAEGGAGGSDAGALGDMNALLSGEPASRRREALTIPSQAVRLARDLAGLMDLVETERVSLEPLRDFATEQLASHWQITLSLLDILLKDWPAYLKRRSLLSPSDRRNRLIEAQADFIASGTTTGPIVVAGVTGSIPATQVLMQAVANHPQGAIVLPGLDQLLDDESFGEIRSEDPRDHHPEHPQFGLSHVLSGLGVKRADVVQLGAETIAKPGMQLGMKRGTELAAKPSSEPARDPAIATSRARVFSEALRPARTTDRWTEFASGTTPTELERALDGVSLITAPTALDEAEVVALILREALETPGQTAALISPDRLLARRVATRLKTWGIDVDDSAGRPFRKTPPGALIDLVLDVATTNFDAASLAALLRHPLCRLGLRAGDIRKRARNLELAALRTSDLGLGIDGLSRAVHAAHEDVTSPAADGRRRARGVVLMRDQPEEWAAIDDLLDRLAIAFAPFRTCIATPGPQPLHTLVAALAETAEALAPPPPLAVSSSDATSVDTARPVTGAASSALGTAEYATQVSPIWQGEAGGVAANVFARLLDEQLDAPRITAADFPEFYRALVAGETVRATTAMNPRLAIWGPVEARLQSPDIAVLGGLNDGVWPKLADAGPWLNRPMRQEIGLPQPEEEIGRAAHDFMSLCGTRQVYLTRAEKVDGAPTVPSRWLMRLQTVLASAGMDRALAPKRPWLAWALARTKAPAHAPCRQPEPRPPVALRPKRLSVTNIETWIANPYALFAQKVLQLEPLDPIGKDPDAAMRGTIVHEALGRFAERYPDTLPDDPARILVAIAEELLAGHTDHPAIAAFWAPRFARFADWFAATEPNRRKNLVTTLAEVPGRITVAGARANLVLTARADRLDQTSDGLAIYDYKGGSKDTIEALARRAGNLQAPQLPLEAAIALEGGFEASTGDRIRRQTIPTAADGSVALTGLAFISTAGGEPPGADVPVKFKEPIAEAATRALTDLRQLIDLFADPETPYRAIRRPSFDYRYDDYEQLARIKEWSSADHSDGADS